MAVISMLSSADRVKGQGVGSAYREQVELVREGLKGTYKVLVNKPCIADITHYHTIDLKYFLGIPIARMTGKAVGYVHFLPETIEGSIKLPPLIRKAFYRYIISFYRGMDRLVTVNPYFIERLRAYGIPAEKISYIPNYVSDRDFHPLGQDEINRIREQYGLEGNRFTVLGVGQVQTRKGVRDFIEVARRMPEAQFLWAGGFSFGRITDGYHELKRLVEAPPTNVRFLGIVPRERMNGLYNIADVLFMPSYNELFPMAILEALNCGKPILLRDLDIYHNILFNYYLKGADNDAFCDHLRRLGADPDYYSRWSGMARECGRFYSRENVLALWKQFYDTLFGESMERHDALRSIIDRIMEWKESHRKKRFRH